MLALPKWGFLRNDPKAFAQSFLLFCMYGNKTHKSSACDKHKTPQERSQCLWDSKLCLIWASPQHSTTQCKKPPCSKCRKPNHSSCCFQFMAWLQSSSGTKKKAEPRRGKKKKAIKTYCKDETSGAWGFRTQWDNYFRGAAKKTPP